MKEVVVQAAAVMTGLVILITIMAKAMMAWVDCKKGANNMSSPFIILIRLAMSPLPKSRNKEVHPCTHASQTRR
jgi:hypothetical protein